MNYSQQAGVIDPLRMESDEPLGSQAAEPNRRQRSREAAGFQAKLAIPSLDEPLDDSWQEKHRIQRERMSNARKLDRVTDQMLNSRGFQVARVSLLVATGGLCAGLALFMKDRNWVLDLPWRPNRPATVVETPRKMTPVKSPATAAEAAKSKAPAVDEPNPFLVEDSSDLEGQSTRMLAPLPTPVSVPVGATPIAAGKKEP